jgi:hypothetical protein
MERSFFATSGPVPSGSVYKLVRAWAAFAPLLKRGVGRACARSSASCSVGLALLGAVAMQGPRPSHHHVNGLGRFLHTKKWAPWAPTFWCFGDGLIGSGTFTCSAPARRTNVRAISNADLSRGGPEIAPIALREGCGGEASAKGEEARGEARRGERGAGRGQGAAREVEEEQQPPGGRCMAPKALIRQVRDERYCGLVGALARLRHEPVCLRQPATGRSSTNGYSAASEQSTGRLPNATNTAGGASKRRRQASGTRACPASPWKDMDCPPLRISPG